MAATPKSPTTLDNDPPILEDGHDDLFGNAFAFNAKIAEVIQGLAQPEPSEPPSEPGGLQELILGSDKKAFVNLTGLLLASCRIQTGVSCTMADWTDNHQSPPTVHTGFIPFQEGKFTEPPFVLIQGFVDYLSPGFDPGDWPQGDYMSVILNSIQIDRVTTSGCRVSHGLTDEGFKFYWMAIQPPWGWKESQGYGGGAVAEIVENDPTIVGWSTK